MGKRASQTYNFSNDGFVGEIVVVVVVVEALKRYWQYENGGL